MSFILDALKKSEAERQRQAGPTLLEVRVTQPRRRYPLWALLIAALLAVNVLVLLIFVLHRPKAPALETESRYVAPAAAAAPVPAPAAATAEKAPAATAPAAAAPSMAGPAAAANPATLDTTPDPTTGDADAGHNPTDDEPAIAPTGTTNKWQHGSRDSSDSGGREGSVNYGSLPSSTEIDGDLPALRLDLHVYAERPDNRYALINMHKVREGDVLPEGVRVLAITHDGVALSYRGQDFMLRPQ